MNELQRNAPWCEHGSDDRCEYSMDGTFSAARCGRPRTHAVIFHIRRHPLCEEHAKPKYHPPDLRMKIVEAA